MMQNPHDHQLTFLVSLNKGETEGGYGAKLQGWVCAVKIPQSDARGAAVKKDIKARTPGGLNKWISEGNILNWLQRDNGNGDSMSPASKSDHILSKSVMLNEPEDVMLSDNIQENPGRPPTSGDHQYNGVVQGSPVAYVDGHAELRKTETVRKRYNRGWNFGY